MIIVDTALAARERNGNPIRVAMFGAGFMARGIVNQIANSVPGMVLTAIANRDVRRALDATDCDAFIDVHQRLASPPSRYPTRRRWTIARRAAWRQSPTIPTCCATPRVLTA